MLTLGTLHPVFASLMVIGTTALCCALLLGLAGAKRRRRSGEVIEDILLCLPQTQCGQCGHPGCQPYAEAIAAGDPINRCPPGGTITIQALAKLLDVPEIALDPIHGTYKPREVAYIREAECIGCVKCIAACPVDAILGASGQMHTVIALECTGCDLCVEPCPVDCIEMRVVPADQRDEQEQRQRAQLARRRFEARQSRIHDTRQLEQTRRSARESSPVDARAAQVEAAVARVRARTLQQPGTGSRAAASAVERARRKALDRVAKAMPADTTPSPPPTPETLQRRLTRTERKLQRTRQKHAAACAAADTETVALLAQAIMRLEQRLADVRHDLQHLPGADP